MSASTERALWEQSGAFALTGPLPPPGRPATWTQQMLDVVAEQCGRRVAEVEVLGARAAHMGLARNPPWSAGGAYRAFPTRDGWFGISLSRVSDCELVPALVEDGQIDDPWAAVEAWLGTTTTDAAAARTALLGLAAAPVPERVPEPARPPVVVSHGGLRRRRRRVPLVVDLSSLWAGPLCAHLLHNAGARVIAVESSARPDGARIGSPSFYASLHDGHESAVLDFMTEVDELRALIAAADVVIEASRPRALAQLGIDARAHVDAGTIWVSITAYGRRKETRVGFGDDVAMGAGLYVRDGEQPCPVGDALADPLTGVTAAAAAALALNDTKGCLLDVSMHDVAVASASEQGGLPLADSHAERRESVPPAPPLELVQ